MRTGKLWINLVWTSFVISGFLWFFMLLACGFTALVLRAENSKGVIALPNAVQAKQPMSEWFLDAIQQIESGGDDSAVGDGGKAVGAYQIWPIYVDDVNRILKTESFTLTDRWDAVKSRDMVRIYLNHYATDARLGYTPTYEDMARIHNGGPNGYKKDCTKAYWGKVKKILGDYHYESKVYKTQR